MSFTYLLLFLSLLPFKSMSLISSNRCPNAGNFTTKGTYGRNLDIIFSSLASNVTANGGFYNVTIGQEPDKVYALTLCRGDASSENCSSCVNSGIHDIISNCPNQKEAVSWGLLQTPCIVRYSNRSIFGKMELEPHEAGYNLNEITSNLTEFDQTWDGLMDRVVKSTSAGSSRLKFGTGEATNVTFPETIYALMQCTPDISESDCDFCLRQSLARFQDCCYGKQGGYVLRPSCYLRWDLYPFYGYIADAPSQPPSNIAIDEKNEGISSGTIAIIIVSSIIFIALVAFIYVYDRRRKSKQKKTSCDEMDSGKSLQFDFSTVTVATNNFSIDSKLGQGGFGVVYKGRLPDGQDVAVKRLSRDSGQGEAEFKNEVLLLAKLQHRNLVRLLGFCLERNERLLIYEFVPNASLDNFIFHPIKRLLLNWDMRYRIIGGIARGILYLHEESKFRIIHRDLKASNILLDVNMDPKISDFGMARLFEIDQTRGDTSRIVGTFGYMAPEYVLRGHFSIKSDVFSFGVLVLEIISGHRNSNLNMPNSEETQNLLTYAWKNWREGTPSNLIDPTLRDGGNSDMLRCIHIGLLCVQENIASRPTMASVDLMLTSYSMSLPLPSKPAFFLMDMDSPESITSDQPIRNSNVNFSVNEASITELEPR